LNNLHWSPALRAKSGGLGGTTILCKAEIGDCKEARAMAENVGKDFTHLDILVNNAGITRDSFLHGVSPIRVI
jgi:short-subunit dehydrogenase involved in D-alanine esterification of teichoic acids